MHPELTRQLGDRSVPSDRRQRHLRLESRVVFLSCPLHVLLPRYPRVLGAGLHLSQLSHFRGPPHSARWMLMAAISASDTKMPLGYWPVSSWQRTMRPVWVVVAEISSTMTR